MPGDPPFTEPDFVAATVLDLSASLAIPIAEIAVEQVKRVTWRDGSLGCPEPGMYYSQALVDGFHVILRAGGRAYDYRVGRNGSFRRCLEPPDEALADQWDDSRM